MIFHQRHHVLRFAKLFTVLCSSAVVVVNSQMYHMKYGPQVGNAFPFSSVETSSSSSSSSNAQQISQDGKHRYLQAPTDCNPVGAKFKCLTSTVINENTAEGNATGYTELTIDITCDFDSQIKFDFRRAKGCVCEAKVHRVAADGSDDSVDKYCPCDVCAPGFGDVPVSIDCSAWADVTRKPKETATMSPSDSITGSVARYLQTDNTNVTGGAVIDPDPAAATTVPITGGAALPEAGTNPPSEMLSEMPSDEVTMPIPDVFITEECSSLDCGMGCNGTCRLDCSTSDESCKFCANNPDNQATDNPNPEGGQDDGDLKNFDGSATQGSHAVHVIYSIAYYSFFAFLPTLASFLMLT